ncbi:ABC transporter substrate-binding protein [Anaerocolumna sp. MB42-C2]|uniref:ABC transporter substrate-binding protein n=1 Tax=Anaerocolumna sp. MB42-C2 TaxID=3070997 RepID=UPI0027DEF832|nr:ABC transporter substrate-binding protein [Anaerocolumna sp. MB42-C2]WMJ87460.1 ABC transporter substrate-binding protein [Anaerocolumna sp. MB42-C2]
MMKRMLSCLMVMVMVITMLTACGGKKNSEADTAASVSEDTQKESGDGDAAVGEKKKIVFWYSHKGDEATCFENAIKAYNESQDKYEVEGLSATDNQKIIVAISGNEAPDVVETSNQNIITYANSGLIDSISDMATAENYSLTDQFSNQSLEANTLNDKIYGMPYAAMIIQMFYNKDILQEIGYTEPPKTMEELYDMAVKATEVDGNGTITRLGYPLFPLASARQELIYAFGGRWWSDDGKTLTPDNPGIADSLNMNLKYRSQYGIEKVQEFVATANTNRYTENDMFFAGKQLFRFDGTWLAAMIKNFNSDVNYGVALIPGTKAHPELQGTSRYETNSLAIPVVSKEKEGAWDFIKFFTTSEATKELLIGMANLPTQPSLYDDPDILAQPNFDIFIEALKKENGIEYPKIADLSKYTSLIEEHLDYLYNGMDTPENVLKALSEQAKLLQ